MSVDPDRTIVLRLGIFALNETIVFTWAVMALLIGASLFASRGLRPGSTSARSRQAAEMVVGFLEGQIRGVMGTDPRPFLPFLGTLFLFIFISNVLEIVPLFRSPTASLSTTAALALSVFAAVPVFGVRRRGLRAYLKSYAEPSIVLVPFNLLGELTRTVSLAVRLFGNIMSGSLVAGVVLSIAPLFVPVLVHVFGLLIGGIQAYIFLTLATVYIGGAASARREG